MTTKKPPHINLPPHTTPGSHTTPLAQRTRPSHPAGKFDADPQKAVTAAEVVSYLRAKNWKRTKPNVVRAIADIRARKRLDYRRYTRGKEQAATDPANPWQIIYGIAKVGGTITFIHTTGPSDRPDLYLHLVITLAAHEITNLQYVYFNETALSWDTDLTTRPTGVVNATGIFAGFVQMQINYGSDSQSALSSLVANCPSSGSFTGWTSTAKQSGHAHVYIQLSWNEILFKTGIPDITFQVVGKYDMVDPRTGSAAHGAANSAMVLYDYMTNTRWGLGISTSAFNTTRLNHAVDVCEATVSLAGGGSENAYLTNGHIGADDAPGDVVQDMLIAMAGRLVYSEGKWSIYAGEWRSPVVSLSEADILSDIQVITKTPRTDSFNSVRGTYTSSQAGFVEDDFPIVKNSTYITQDSGSVMFEDLTYLLVTSSSAVQRLSKIELERNRLGISIEFTATMKAYQAEPAETFQLTFSKFGWSSKVFEVVTSTLQVIDDDNGVPFYAVHITAKEVASSSPGEYDWNSGMETTVALAATTNLPNPFTVPSPTGLTLASGTSYLYIRADGTVFSRIYASWTAPASAFVQNGGNIEIQYKLHSGSNWQDATSVPGNSTYTYILDVQDGSAYDVQIRAVNAIGARGSWVQALNHTVVGKTAPPSDVTGLASSLQGFTIKLTWNAISDLDLREYEVRLGTTSDTWSSATPLTRIKTTAYYYEVKTAATYRFFLKAIDTSGNYSTNAVTVDQAIAVPGTPTVSSTLDGDSYVLSWTVPSSAFAVKEYEIRYGASYAAGTPVAIVTALRYRFKALWGGSRTYWVVARDVAGNESSTAGSTSISITSPGAPQSLTVQLLDNNVLLKWSPPSTGTLPIGSYNVYRGTYPLAFGTASLIGSVLGTFFTYVELVSGSYSYWVTAVDSAANEGSTATVNAVVTVSPDYLAKIDQFLTAASATVVNGLANSVTVPSGGITMPLNVTETVAQHFTNNSKTTIQDFINAGYGNILTPNPLTSSAEWTVDYGVIYSQGYVTFDLKQFDWLNVQMHDTITLSFRKTTSDPWTSTTFTRDAYNVQIQATNFQYVKVHVDGAASSDQNWAEIYWLRLRLSLLKTTDSGTIAAVSTDSGGTTVTMNKTFLEVLSIQGTPQSTTAAIAVCDFTNPTPPATTNTFKLLLFDKNGTRISGNVRWNAEGYASGA